MTKLIEKLITILGIENKTMKENMDEIVKIVWSLKQENEGLKLLVEELKKTVLPVNPETPWENS